ncbi:MAG: hypothetical protein OQL06_11725 [Gammaproteobacteria bacterium]|nr:hypothetical protein [Gammaproteobacteria bacterium]
MLDHLQKYIGNEIVYKNTRCQLIEVLEDGPALVFICLEHKTSIQSDQHGGAHRRVHETYTVPCLSEVHEDLHPVVKEILPDEIHVEFLEFLISA